MNTTPIAFYVAANAKRETLKKRIARYTDYVVADLELSQKSEKHAKKYASRLKNHRDKLARYAAALIEVEAFLKNAHE